LNKKRSYKEFWIWGQFNDISTKVLKKAKNEVNKNLNGPTFNAHLTLSGPFASFENTSMEKLQKLSNKLNPVKLYSEGIQTKGEFFQALFIKIHLRDDLLEFKRCIDNEFQKQEKGFFPHISLFYGNETAEKKKREAKKIVNLKDNFIMDRISLAEVDEKISSWKVVKTYSLFKLNQ